MDRFGVDAQHWGGGGGAQSVYMSFCASFRPGLLTSCRASSWVPAAAGNFFGVSGLVLDLQAHKTCALHRGAGPLPSPRRTDQPWFSLASCHPSYRIAPSAQTLLLPRCYSL